MSERGRRKVSRLAQRFQAAIDQDAAAARVAEELAREEQQRLDQARTELLDDLEAFGRAVGHFEVDRREGYVVLRYNDHSLRFEAVGERGKVKVEGEGLEGDNKLFLQEPLDRWVWSREDRYGREHREMLFDSGLEKLVAVVLEIVPLADDELPALPVPSPEPTEDPPAESVPFPPKTL